MFDGIQQTHTIKFHADLGLQGDSEGVSSTQQQFCCWQVKCQTGYLQVVSVGMIISSSERLGWSGDGMEGKKEKQKKEKR